MMPQQYLILLLTALLASNVMATVDSPPQPEVNLQPTDSPQAATPPGKNKTVPSRGELLYSNHCLMCHESIVHIREKRHARNLATLRSAILRWSQELELKWSPRDIEDVVLYLNLRYYHYTK